MKTLVLYESFFGNTEKIALKIAETLQTNAVEFSEFNMADLKNVDLLIVGCPTRAFRPSPATTEFLNKLADGSLKGIKVAAFDTRIDAKDIKSKFARIMLGVMIKLFGYAAQPIANRLVSKGGILATKPGGFYVLDSEGPLRNGELGRAMDFAKQIIK